jgi:transposase
MMSLRDVAAITHLGWDTVKSIVKSDLLKRYADVPLKDVTRIAIDENYLGKKAKFVTLVIDLDSGHVLWIGEGRGKAALEGFWPKLQGSKAKISAVACDMSAAYWAAVIEHLADAAVVFDQLLSLRSTLRAACGWLSRYARLHIIKLANEAIDEVRRGLQRTLDLTGTRA